MIKNRVEASGLITIDPEAFAEGITVVDFDLSQYLWQGLALREKDFREAMKNIRWAKYSESVVALHCSADAIIPIWAWMIPTASLAPYAALVHHGTPQQALEAWVLKRIDEIDPLKYRGARVVIKGCGNRSFSPAVQIALTVKLRHLSRSIMFGEPCATVPVYKATL
ncbi:MAG: DUF2480 family protein [Flavobacteriales bacterium]|nr:DUF2480 family protein [Flavobacteriales bacterium]